MAALIVALGMILGIILLRRALLIAQQRTARVANTWRDVLMGAVTGHLNAERLPRLNRKDQIEFLKLWNYYHGSLRGKAIEGLNSVALQLGVDNLARRLHARGGRAERLLAILTLGNLRDAASWAELQASANGKDTVASLNAARALIQINPERGASILMPMLLARGDWDIARVGHMFQGASECFSALLAARLGKLPAGQRLRALRLAHSMHLQLPADGLRELLRGARDASVIVAVYRAATGPALLPEIRAGLRHEDWRVRVGAVNAIARLGQKSDVHTLTALLADPQWWVRYRGAQALAGPVSISPQGLKELWWKAKDPGARAILYQVCVERGVLSMPL
ncbi:MAG: HEAT repeat domain-containing protein [Rhodoferax sp.]